MLLRTVQGPTTKITGRAPRRSGSSRCVVGFVAAVAGLGLVACGAPGISPDAMPADADPTCLEAEQHSDLAWIQDNILTPSCARFTACHQGRARMAAALNLEPGMSHDAMVGVDSTLFPEFKRVSPGDPAGSYLMIILGQFDGPLPETGTMPWNSGLLCEPMRGAIERWIAAGANP
jgi:hypothetical protein